MAQQARTVHSVMAFAEYIRLNDHWKWPELSYPQLLGLQGEVNPQDYQENRCPMFNPLRGIFSIKSRHRLQLFGSWVPEH